jgi:hypothetical protein
VAGIRGDFKAEPNGECKKGEAAMAVKSVRWLRVLLLVSAMLGGITLCQAISIEIANVNSDNFPGVHVFVRAVDDSGNYLEDLGPSNFEMRENGILVNTSVQAQFGYMTVCLVMDASNSMTPFAQQVISACTFFVNGMDELDKGAIVRFSNTPSLIVPMTYDKAALLAGVNSYQTVNATNLWGAIDMGISACYYEPGKKAVITFTDGWDNIHAINPLVLPEHAGSDITLYNIGIGDVNEDTLIMLAEQTGGFFLPIDNVGQMQQVLDDIRNDIGNLYDVFYQTPDTATNGTLRSIQLICNYQNQSDWDTVSYHAPSNRPPEITLSPTTLLLLGTPQNQNTPVNIACTITTTAGVSNARIYYKSIGMLYFNQADLIHGSGSNYSYSIPGSVAQNPGLEFYLQATDSRGTTVTSPKFEPGNLPYFISVLPNYPPQITYNPPGEWLIRLTLDVYATVTDATNNVAEVTLYYRNPEEFFYTGAPMQSLGGNLYKATVPGNYIDDLNGLKMFIAAWDNHGLASYWHLSDAPFSLNVVNELSPTPPQIVLTPANPPIVIPATGGSFTYNRKIINPLPIIGTCDVWCEIVKPSGAVQEVGETILNLSLAGGTYQEQNYTQEVPDTAAPGQYWFRAHTGTHSTLESFSTDSFPFTKSLMAGEVIFNRGWNWYPGVNPFTNGFDPIDRPRLSQASPNPFNATTSLEYTIPEAGSVKLAIHDLVGREILCLDEGFRAAGTHRLTWDASAMSSGIYFCRLAAGATQLTVKLCLVK